MSNKVYGIAKRRSLTSRLVPFVLGLAVLGLGYLIYRSAAGTESDFLNSVEASRQWQSGQSAYEGRSFDGRAPESPTFLLLLAPLTRFDASTAELVWIGASLLLLLHALSMMSQMLAYEGIALGPRVSRCAPWLALILLSPFVVELVVHRRSGLLAMWLTIAAIYLLARRRDIWAGAFLGIAAAIHIIPIALAPWLVYKRRWVAAACLTVGLSGVAALPVLFSDQEVDRTSAHYSEYASVLAKGFDEESLDANRQSLRPFVLATIAPHVQGREDSDGKGSFLASDSLFSVRKPVISGLSIALVALCAFWIRSGRAGSAMRFPGDFILLGEAGLVLATMLLISPFSQADDYVWLLPGVVFLFASVFGGSKRCRIRSGLGLVVVTAFLTLPNDTVLAFLEASWGKTWLGYHGLAVGVLAVLLFLGWTLRGEGAIRGAMALRRVQHKREDACDGLFAEQRTDRRGEQVTELHAEQVHELLKAMEDDSEATLDLEAIEARGLPDIQDDEAPHRHPLPAEAPSHTVRAQRSPQDDGEPKRHGLPTEAPSHAAPGFPGGTPPALTI